MVQARGSIPLGGTKILLLNFLKLKIMCIISIKKRGVKFQSTETIKAMCDNNPDGFSMVYQIGKCKPEIYKTLNKEKFLNQYKKITTMYDADNVSMFIHARIKTHGTKRIENCHGWKADGLIFAHNGILPIDNRGDMTDSETFFRDLFIPAYEKGGWEGGERAINAVIGRSKFVFMDDKGAIRKYGNWIEVDGIFYSNETYKKREVYNFDWMHGTSYYPAKTRSTAYDWRQAYKHTDVPF